MTEFLCEKDRLPKLMVLAYDGILVRVGAMVDIGGFGFLCSISVVEVR